MKKNIKLGLILILGGVFSLGITSMSDSHKPCYNGSNEVEVPVDIECSHHTSCGANDLECPACGGKLTYSYKLFPKKVECASCKGKGTLGQGKYKSKCTNCKGTGKDTVYDGGYKCKSCNYKRKG